MMRSAWPGAPGPGPGTVPAPMEAVVDLHDAVVLLGRFPALAGVTVTIGAGELVVLRGPNGAGKTTLLRLCAGLLPRVRGSATVLGLDTEHGARALARRVGLLGHRNGLYEDLTARENMRFWGRAIGASRDEQNAALAALGIEGRLAEVAVGRLSAGQRRRTALAVLAARRPELWLLDEPHTGLDTDGRDRLDGLLRAAVTAGATVLLASHDLDRAAGLATRTLTLVGGRVAGDEPAAVPPAKGGGPC